MSAAIKVQKSVKEQVSPEEWQKRVDLAACYRLVDYFGMTELTGNHISTRVPGREDEFLINPYGMLYEEVTASSLIRINLDGDILFNQTEYGINKAGFVIHGAIHAAHHDVDCAAHTHTPAGMAVSAMECGLMPLAQSGMRFTDIAYHDYEGPASVREDGPEIVRDLGNKEAMVMRNHGLLAVGRSIPSCFQTLYRLERACQVQIMAMSCNTPLRQPSKDVMRSTSENQRLNPARIERREAAWPALLRKLDRLDPSYRE